MSVTGGTWRTAVSEDVCRSPEPFTKEESDHQHNKCGIWCDMLHIFGQFAPARKICLNIRKQMKKDYSATISCGISAFYFLTKRLQKRWQTDKSSAGANQTVAGIIYADNVPYSARSNRNVCCGRFSTSLQPIVFIPYSDNISWLRNISMGPCYPNKLNFKESRNRILAK